MILGIGTDIVEVKRIKRMIEEHPETFLDRIFTVEEQTNLAERKDIDWYYAGRWAAKEALSKALGCGISEDCGWQDVTVLNNPSGGPEMKLTGRAALTAEALPAFLESLESYQGRTITKLALKLLMHTFVRPGEIRGARWQEFNLEKKEWRIPAARMKMNEEHIIPLSEQATLIISELKLLTGKYDLVFPSVRNSRKPMSENTLTFAIRKRLGFDATAHGCRATASTILNEAGFRPDAIERQLAHAERNKVRAAYNRSQYLSERRDMMSWWGNYLEHAKTDRKIVQIKIANG